MKIRKNCEDELKKILISACLLGRVVRYDGKALPVSDKILKAWIRQGRTVAVCPEVMAGMDVPRTPAELIHGDGDDVLDGKAIVADRSGNDLTDDFLLGARKALDLCRLHHIDVAVLSEASPSCGSARIHDGSFSGRKAAGMGVTTALLRRSGIRVFNQYDLMAAEKALQG